MDDRNVANWAGGVVLGLMLVALAWLLLSPSTGTSAGHDLPVSHHKISHAWDPNRPPEHQRQRCVDAVAARGVTGCVAASFRRLAPATPSGRPAQVSTSPVGAGVTPQPTQVLASSAPAGPPPATVQPATVQPSTSSPPAPTRQPLSHHGPVPGGNTSPPHAGPSP